MGRLVLTKAKGKYYFWVSVTFQQTSPFCMTCLLYFFADKGLLNGLLYVHIHSGREFHKNGNSFKVNKKYGFKI